MSTQFDAQPVTLMDQFQNPPCRSSRLKPVGQANKLGLDFSQSVCGCVLLAPHTFPRISAQRARDGDPHRDHARNSSTRHRTLPLILTGAGISPAAFARRQLRSEIPNSWPAPFALIAMGGNSTT